MKKLLAITALPVMLMQQCDPPPAADGTGIPGDCASYHDDMAAAGLPVNTFSRIAWRETRCDPDIWVVDRDDEGGVMFGLNFKGRNMKRYWLDACGATVDNIRGNVPLQMQCAAAAYDQVGLRPWRTG
jgi:hypothetical protein